MRGRTFSGCGINSKASLRDVAAPCAQSSSEGALDHSQQVAPEADPMILTVALSVRDILAVDVWDSQEAASITSSLK